MPTPMVQHPETHEVLFTPEGDQEHDQHLSVPDGDLNQDLHPTSDGYQQSIVTDLETEGYHEEATITIQRDAK